MSRRNELAQLDADVLRTLLSRGFLPTYVIRNEMVAQREAKQAWPGLKTSRVLTACKRLEQAGALDRVPTELLVQLSWQITDFGRRRLQITDEFDRLTAKTEAQKAEAREAAKFYGGSQWPN